MKHVLLTSALLASLGGGCTSGRDQLDTPGDQSKEINVEAVDQLIPIAPTKPGAGLTDGRYVEPDQKKIDERNKEIASSEIFMNSTDQNSRGLAGVSFGMTKKDIIEKLGQPTAEGYYGYLYGTQYLLIYSAAKTIIAMNGNLETDTPSIISAVSGYLGKFKSYDGTTLGIESKIQGSVEEFTKKQFNYVMGKPLGEECDAFCQATPNNADKNYLVYLDNIGYLFVDFSSGQNLISEIHLISRSVKSKALRNADLAKATLSGMELGIGWPEVNGILAPEFIKDDFTLGVRSTGISLSNGGALNFSTKADATDPIPTDKSKLISFGINSSFKGDLVVNGKVICFTESFEFSTSESTCSTGLRKLTPRVLNGQSRIQLKGFIEGFKTFLKAEIPGAKFSVTSGLLDVEDYNSYGFSVYNLDGQQKGTKVDVRVGPFSRPNVTMSAGLIDGDQNSYGELQNVVENEGGRSLPLLANKPDPRKNELPISIGGVALESIVVLSKTNEDKKFATVNVYPIESYNIDSEGGEVKVVGPNYSKEPKIKDAFTTYAENLVLSTSSMNGADSSINVSNVTRVTINGVTAYLTKINDNTYKIFALNASYDLENLKLDIPCLKGEKPEFGMNASTLLDRIVGSECSYLLPKESDSLENLTAIYLPSYKAKLLMSDKRFANILISQ